MSNRLPLRALPALISAALLALPTAAVAQQASLTPYQSLGRDLLKQMVETNTEYSIGSTTKLAESLAARFHDAGFPAADVQVIGPDSGNDAKDKNLIVRYRGRSARAPILLIGHLDVVEAKRSDWVLDPFTLTERDGHFYGRGTLDMKDGDASWVAALLRMKKEGFVQQWTQPGVRYAVIRKWYYDQWFQHVDAPKEIIGQSNGLLLLVNRGPTPMP